MIRLLLDEDIKANTLIRLLREAGHDVVTTADLALDGKHDIDVLTGAIRESRVVLTYNCDDFRLLHQDADSHSGIVLVYQEPGKSMSYTQIVTALGNLDASGALVASSLHALNLWSY